MSPRIPSDQVSPYPGGSGAPVDGRRLDDRDLILKRRRSTRYGDTPADDSGDYFLTAVQVRRQRIRYVAVAASARRLRISPADRNPQAAVLEAERADHVGARLREDRPQGAAQKRETGDRRQ
jgi:hypothetical protein